MLYRTILTMALIPFYAFLIEPHCRSAELAEPAIHPDEGRPRVAWDATEQVVGRFARVVGRVARAGGTSRVHFLNFDATRRDQFKVVIFEEDKAKFSAPLSDFEGKIIEVRGKVTRYAGLPQMVVRDPDQISVLTDMPDLSQPPEASHPRSPVDSHRGTRVATFNVENLFDAVDEPYTDDEGTAPKPRAALQQLAATFHRLNADVVALQEVEDRRYLERFVEVFLSDLGYHNVVCLEGNDDRGIDVAVLSRLPIGPVTSHRHRTFPGPHGPMRFQRDLLCVTVEPPSGEDWEMWVVHLKSNADGRESAEPLRRAEVTALQQIYQQRLAANPQAKILICGDFNDTAESSSLQPLLQTQSAPRSFFEEIPFDKRITYTREPYRSMIDYIFASPAMAARYVPSSYQIVDLLEGESGSDHNPVLASFE